MKNNSFRSYLHFSFIKSSIVLILSVFILFIFIMGITFLVTTQRMNHAQNKFTAKQVEAYLKAMDLSAEAITQYDSLNHSLIENAKNSQKLKELLYTQANALPIKCNFALLNMQKKVIASNLYKNNLDVLLKSAVIQDFYSNSSTQKAYIGYSRIPYSNEQLGAILFIQPIVYQNKVVALLYFDIVQETLQDTLVQHKADGIVITDKFDNIAYSTTPDAIGPMNKLAFNSKNGNGFYILNEKRYYISSQKIYNNQLNVFTLSSAVLYDSILWVGIISTAVIALLITLLSFILSKKIINHNLKPFQIAIQAIQSNDFNHSIQEETFDEFQALFEEYNAMLARIDALLARNKQLNDYKRIIEVQHLKDQFNPHFVFNVLENIRYVMLEDVDKAQEMLVSFAHLLRYEINDLDSTIELSTDLEFVNDYLLLQKARYGNNLQYHIDLPDEFRDYKIQKLLIQPIVENAIKHGYKNELLIIEIKVLQENAFVKISIKDNGKGIPKEKLLELQNMLAENQFENTHIGIFNTHRIIKLSYGEFYGLQLESNENGTQVSLYLPEEECNV